jgi:hypothetical protein
MTGYPARKIKGEIFFLLSKEVCFEMSGFSVSNMASDTGDEEPDFLVLFM